MVKKIPAERIKLWCIYKKSKILGNFFRWPVSAWPTEESAKAEFLHMTAEAVKSGRIEEYFRKEHMIEEMPVIMKAWQPA